MGKSEAIKVMEKKLAKVEKNLAETRDDLDEVIADRDSWKAKHEVLVGKYKLAMEQLASSRSPDSTKNDGMVMQTKKMAKGEGWRTFKFINSNKHLRKASIIILDLLELEDCTTYHDDSEERVQEVAVAREQWLNLYSTDVRAGNNEQRSYVQSEMKKIALAWMKSGKTLPTPAEFAKIAQRDLDVSTLESKLSGEEIFDMYMLMLSACSGSSTFGEKHRRSFTISKCKTKKGKQAVPPGSEALVMVMYENCYDKWLEMHKYKEVEKNPGNIPKYSSKRHEETKQWMSKYSDSCCGNSPYGGWSKEGIESFNQHGTIFKNLRKTNSLAYRNVEEAGMLRFSVAYEEERKRKRRENGFNDTDSGSGGGSSRKKKRARIDDPEENGGVLADFDMEED